MRDDDKTDLPGWLGLRKIPDLTKARWLGPLLMIGSGLIVGGLFLLALLTAFILLSSAAFGSLLDDPRSALGVGGVTVALIGAPFVIWRSVVAQKTVNVTEQGHITDRINTAVEGLGAEKTVSRIGRIVKVKAPDGHVRQEIKWAGGKLKEVEGDKIDAEGDWQVFNETLPNLEVRIGAIYALERIAQDSDRDHVQIMEILCAYIRQNAPAPETDDWPVLEMKEGEYDGPLKADWEERLEAFREKQVSAKAALRVREDIQVALTVIGRRSARQRRLEAGRGKEADFSFDAPFPEYDGPEERLSPDALDAYLEKLAAWKSDLEDYEGYRLDLRGTDLRGADLAERELQGAKLNGTYLQGADLVGARLQGAVLWQARLRGSRLRQARLQGADLMRAGLEGVFLWNAQLQGAKLWEARLQGANLGEARLQGANFAAARLQGVRLLEARLQGAKLWAARLQGANLRAARLQGAGLAEARLQGAFLGEARFDAHTSLTAAPLRGAAVRDVDFTTIPQIADHLQGIFGDASVTLPDGHGPGHESWPAHWPSVKLNPRDFVTQWQAWLKDLETEDPPDPPQPEHPA
ncbi:pentapeptide repeat-containing protein [Roseovarius sp. D22-M7]|uniref:pentapeptide repeat-containing protein n=1 Tax=Roseovarius sp. D22-M7 TaxID=3127116 RepID=UPI00300FD8D4